MNPVAILPRRELLRIGGLGILAAAFGDANASAAQEKRHKSCIFILLQGGPSHHDLWDPKPAASAEIRGPFRTIETTAPGVRFGELLTNTARIADRLTVIRSMAHDFNNHIAGTYVTLTGSNNQDNRDREAHADDFPGPGAVLNYLQTSPASVPRSISLPTWLSIPGPSNRMPGQYGGFLGGVNDPFLIAGDPNAADFKPLTLTLPDGMTSGRMQNRLGLREQLDVARRQIDNELSRRYDRLLAAARDMMQDGRVRQALELSREPDSTRDRYGRSKIGQSLLLARRLIEAGVQLVSYNAFNQEWDTHGGLEGRYKQIVPPMEQAFAALVEDLDQRGMLDDTLVVNTGEFGRTPVMNDQAGRDHWPNVYSTVLAGGKVRGGYIHGASDNKGAEVVSGAVAPADVLATMWRHLGIDHQSPIYDRLERPHMISDGRVLDEILAAT